MKRTVRYKYEFMRKKTQTKKKMDERQYTNIEHSEWYGVI